VRSDSRINRVLVAVRGFLSFAVVNKEAPQWVLGVIYELADSRDLPLEAQSEDGHRPGIAALLPIFERERALSAQALADRLIADVLERAGARLQDDMTVFVLKRS